MLSGGVVYTDSPKHQTLEDPSHVDHRSPTVPAGAAAGWRRRPDRASHPVRRARRAPRGDASAGLARAGTAAPSARDPQRPHAPRHRPEPGRRAGRDDEAVLAALIRRPCSSGARRSDGRGDGAIAAHSVRAEKPVDLGPGRELSAPGRTNGKPGMLDRSAVTDELRARVRAELPEVEEIRDPALRAKVVEAWALALAASSFGAIAEIEPSGNPGVNTLKRGSQADHIRGVTRLAMRIADEMSALMPDLKIDRDVLIAGALCHDVGKPWEFAPENRRRWESDPRAAGLPSVRHPAYGVHVCFTVGLPEAVAHCAAAHSGEGELLVRSLENTIVHHADYAFWGICRAGDLLLPESVAELRVRH